MKSVYAFFLVCFVLFFVSGGVSRAQDALAFGMIGQEKMSAGDYEAALISLDRAVKLDPNNSWTRSMRASCHYQLKRYSEARADYAFISQLEPDNETAAAMVSVIDSLVMMQPVKQQATPHGSSVDRKPDRTQVIIGADDTVSLSSDHYGFQVPLPAGAWDFLETLREDDKYHLKCVRRSPSPSIVVQIYFKKLDTALQSEDQEKAFAASYRQNLEQLKLIYPFGKRTARGNRTWWGLFETRTAVGEPGDFYRFMWMLAMKGDRFYSIMYTYPREQEKTHELIAKSVLGNFIPFDSLNR